MAADRKRLDMILRRSKQLGYCSKDLPSIADLFHSADDDFFHRINQYKPQQCTTAILI